MAATNSNYFGEIEEDMKQNSRLHGARWGALLSTLLFPVTANAHFLWGEVSQDNPPVAKISFAEGPGQISEADLVGKIEVARVWADGNKVLAPQTTSGVRVAKLNGARLVGASQTWGVLDKTAEGRGIFKLEYWSKAAATLNDANRSVQLPLELFAQSEGASKVLVTFKHGTQPVGKTAILLFEPNALQPRTLITDANGRTRFETKDSGLYGLRANWNDGKPGEFNGKKYALTRHYTTLTFHAGAPSPSVIQINAKVEPKITKADPQAYALLEAAHNNRQMMPDDFPGFTAKLTYIKDGAATTGTITYRRQGKTEIVLPDLAKDEYSWVEDKTLNLIGHRRGGTFAEGDGRNPLTFGKLPDNYFGKLIELNDGMKSSYRVKDNKVAEVTRTAGGMRFTISVIETLTTDNGKYLANHFLVSYRDEKTGDLKMVEGYRDSYSQIGGVWLPIMRTVVTTGAASPEGAATATMQAIRLTDIKLLESAKVAATQ